MRHETYRAGAAIALLAVGACSHAERATTVVNRSAGMVKINYTDALGGHARSLDLAPGATGRLWRNESVATLSALEIATSERSYGMFNWEAERKRLTCRGNCVIAWEADRKMHIYSNRI